jgi:HK97 family phage prohead protease
MPILNKNNGTAIKFKSLVLDVKAENESRIVSMYLASFNTLDSDCDIIRKGAFSKSISERGPQTNSNRQIKFLHQHQVKEPIGIYKMLMEDEKGLYAEVEIEKTALGDVVLERYMNGSYKEHSIGFQYVWDKCNWIQMPSGEEKEMEDVFECKELNLFEGSVVTFGANENTPFLGFKGNSEDFEKQLDEELKFLLKNAPNYEYELSLRQLYTKQKSLIKSLAENTKEATKPIISPNKSFYLTLL